MADNNGDKQKSIIEKLEEKQIEKKVSLEKLNSPETAFKTIGAFLEGAETLLRFFMIPLFLLGFALWPLGIIGYVFVGLALLNFALVKISGASFKDDFKDEADLLKDDPVQRSLIKDYEDSLKRVHSLKKELNSIESKNSICENDKIDDNKELTF